MNRPVKGICLNCHHQCYWSPAGDQWVGVLRSTRYCEKGDPTVPLHLRKHFVAT